MSQITMDQLSPELIAEIMAMAKSQAETSKELGSSSPIRQQLTDLREPSSQKERIARPQFHFSADPDEAGKKPYKYQEYPKLMWDSYGNEVTVKNLASEDALGEDWSDVPPSFVDDPVASMQDEMAQLSAEERQMVIDAQKQARLARINAKLALMSDADALKAFSAVEDGATPEVAVRKRGRPRKVV